MNDSLQNKVGPASSRERDSVADVHPPMAPIVQRAPRSGAAEAFRSLRTALQFLDPETTKTIVVTSPGPGEGKSTCAANLAVALAQVGRRVLLVDADMRRPSLHDRFHVSTRVGLSHLLVGRDDGTAIVQTEVPGLSVLPAGVVPPNPAEILDGPVLDRWLARWSQEYDHVLLDSPPLLAVTDPLLIARKVRGVLLVARVATTRDGPLQRAAELLRDAGSVILGTVLNDLANSRSGEYGYGYGYGYYGSDLGTD